MTLAEYMAVNRLDEYAFAKMVQKQFPHNSCTFYAVRKWKNGTRKPGSLKMVQQIEELTKGSVCLGDWADGNLPMANPRKIVSPDHYKSKIQKLLDSGESISQISKILNIHRYTIYRLGFKRPDWSEHKRRRKR